MQQYNETCATGWVRFIDFAEQRVCGTNYLEFGLHVILQPHRYNMAEAQHQRSDCH